MDAYAVPDVEPVPFAILGSGWYSKEPLMHAATRWMGGSAELMTADWRSGESSIGFSARSFERPRTLMVFLNDRLVGEYSISLNDTVVHIRGLEFSAGNNTIRFYSPGGCGMQENGFRTMVEDDVRCVSFAFSNITITPEEGA